MTPCANTPHQGGGEYADPLCTFLLERARPDSEPGYPDELSDTNLAFDAIHAAFQAQRGMLRVFSQLRGDEDAVG